jgi:hypothetical protein
MRAPNPRRTTAHLSNQEGRIRLDTPNNRYGGFGYRALAPRGIALEGSGSFLKKRTKKLLARKPAQSPRPTIKSFLLLFFKKEGLPLLDAKEGPVVSRDQIDRGSSPCPRRQ